MRLRDDNIVKNTYYCDEHIKTRRFARAFKDLTLHLLRNELIIRVPVPGDDPNELEHFAGMVNCSEKELGMLMGFVRGIHISHTGLHLTLTKITNRINKNYFFASTEPSRFVNRAILHK